MAPLVSFVLYFLNIIGPDHSYASVFLAIWRFLSYSVTTSELNGEDLSLILFSLITKFMLITSLYCTPYIMISIDENLGNGSKAFQ